MPRIGLEYGDSGLLVPVYQPRSCEHSLVSVFQDGRFYFKSAGTVLKCVEEVHPGIFDEYSGWGALKDGVLTANYMSNFPNLHVKAFEFARDVGRFSENPNLRTGAKLTQTSANMGSAGLGSVLGLKRIGAIDLNAVTVQIMKVARVCCKLVIDFFNIYNLFDELFRQEAVRRDMIGVSEEVFDAEETARITNIVRIVLNLALHILTLLALVAEVVISKEVILILSAAYLISAIVYKYLDDQANNLKEKCFMRNWELRVDSPTPFLFTELYY